MYLKDKLLVDNRTFTPAEQRQRLVSLLRNPSQWPEGFRWNYREGDTCALGLASDVLGMPIVGSSEMGVRIGLTEEDGQRVFIGAGLERGRRPALFGLISRPAFKRCFMWEVTPKRVADVIEYLADGKLPA